MPLGGMFILGFFFSPQFRQLVGGLLVLSVILIALVVVALIGRAIWRYKQNQSQSAEYVPPASHGAPAAPAYLSARDIEKISGAGWAGNVAATEVVSPPRVWSRELLSKLEWKRFEEVVAAYTRELGHDARVTRIGPDGGVDVEILDRATGKVGSVIQCKAWDAYRVGIKPVRELLGVMAASKVTEGGFFTTGQFTQEAREFAATNGIDLVDGAEFLKRMHQLPVEATTRLHELATEGDYATPTCPSCGVKMVLRTAGKGRNEGSQFWGCPRYPRCRSALKVSNA